MELLVGLMALPSVVGLFLMWHVLRPQRNPADKSNRINKARLLLFALTREDMFVSIFPWLKRDEKENMRND